MIRITANALRQQVMNREGMSEYHIIFSVLGIICLRSKFQQ